MNTLNKNITENFYKDKTDGYRSVTNIWKDIVNSPTRELLTAEDHLLYAIVRGKDYTKGFTSVTNKNKLANGRREHDTLNRTISSLKLFVELLSKEKINPYAERIISEKALKPLIDQLDREGLLQAMNIISYEVDGGKRVPYLDCYV